MLVRDQSLWPRFYIDGRFVGLVASMSSQGTTDGEWVGVDWVMDPNARARTAAKLMRGHIRRRLVIGPFSEPDAEAGEWVEFYGWPTVQVMGDCAARKWTAEFRIDPWPRFTWYEERPPRLQDTKRGGPADG